MAYQIATCATFMNDLVAAPHKIQKKLKEIMKVLRETPAVQRGKLTKKLQGFAKLWRYALEDPEYRIIYEVDEKSKTVKLLMMGPRKDGKIYTRLHTHPDRGPAHIPVEAVPLADPFYVAEKPEVLQPKTPVPPSKTSSPLPSLSEACLEQWQIDRVHWPTLLKCKTEDDVLNADLPQHVKLRVIDCIYPRSIEKVVSQPAYLAETEADLLETAIDGELTKLLLNLDEEQRKALDADMGWPILIKGGPGTGKSVVALYKAAGLVKGKQMEMFRPPTILFTTFTHPLIDASEALFNSYLGKDGARIKIKTINSVAASICRMNKVDLEFLSDTESHKIVSSLLNQLGERRNQLPEQVRAADYVLGEFEWIIEGWEIASFDEYAKQARPGRRIGLTRPQRQIIWDLYEGFKKETDKLGKLTYERAQSLALRYAGESRRHRGEQDHPRSWVFDYVFVDEVQDLKPVGLRLCAALTHNGTNLYLTADMNQAIYGRGVSWGSVVESLNFRGDRTRTLTRNYRSTDQILRASRELISGMKDLDTETVETEPVHTGAKPILRRLKTPADRNQAIATWIQQVLRELRLSRSCAAILCPTKKCVEEMLKSMNDLKLPSVRFRDDTKNLDKPAVKVMTVHSCKGLEFPVVVIPDFRADAFGWLERGDSQAAEETARRIYFVACTRAMKRLLVTRVGDGEDNLTKQLTADNWNMEK